MIRRLIVVLTVCVAFAACQKHRIIPESDMKKIFKEIYLVNAYVSYQGVMTDSMDLYQPVLKKYGYTPRDLLYTMENFSRRKSSRLSDVLDAVQTEMNAEYDYYAGRVAMIDTIENRAGEMFKKQIYTRGRVEVTSMRDTARLRVRIPVEEGKYKVRYTYMIDTADFNSSLHTTITIKDSIGRMLANRTDWMARMAQTSFETQVESSDPGKKRLEIIFGNYGKNATDPRMRIDTLTVFRYLSKQEAFDSLDRKLFGPKYFTIDGKECPDFYTPDSLALRVDPPRLRPEAGGGAR